ncbi:MAG: type II/IV secretion system protein [Candidatus Sungiibacteriota bacterium]|uniref:Type II/IV secretion system protein n=1 Tax=Candidatus Sungiibacteriota bacterium TaxID=2750080 RepID=A0A7T5UR09_9BACT|nr:MAG: type II/IV secretion system protein [Candidatus Sungbacteria bacterium]
MKVEEGQLKAFILDSGLVPADKVKKAEEEAQKTGKTLREILLNKGYTKEDEIKRLEAYIMGIPFVDLTHETIDTAVLYVIPEPIARKNNVISYKKTGKDLEIAMLDPDDLQTVEFIRKKSGLRILPRLTTPESIQHALKQYQKTLEVEFGEIIKKETEALKVAQEGDAGEIEAEELKKLAEDLPVIKIVDTLIRHAILQNASDIHVEPAEKEVVARYRIDGVLHDAMTLPKQIAPGIVARIKVMANLKLDEHRLPQDGRFKIETDEYRFSFRVSVLPVFDGEKIVLRLLPETAKGYSLEELGFWGENLERIHRAIKRPTGIILATGPTGSGKTTTLYSILEILNIPGVNISTIEDPIEYRIPRINQTQVHPDIGLSFANGLRSLLRQDPNILMVGEIRDNETAGLAINAALTGHLVLSTLHTNSAAGALPRLLDMKVEPFLIASTVTAIISQRLVRRLCPEHEKYRLSAAQIASLKKDVNLDRILEVLKHEKIIDAKTTFEKIEWGRHKKTEECPDGYKGRIGIHEVLEMSESIKELVVKNATSDDIEKRGREEGMLTMLEEGFIRAAQRVTSIEEVLRVTSE